MVCTKNFAISVNYMRPMLMNIAFFLMDTATNRDINVRIRHIFDLNSVFCTSNINAQVTIFNNFLDGFITEHSLNHTFTYFLVQVRLFKHRVRKLELGQLLVKFTNYFITVLLTNFANFGLIVSKFNKLCHYKVFCPVLINRGSYFWEDVLNIMLKNALSILNVAFNFFLNNLHKVQVLQFIKHMV